MPNVTMNIEAELLKKVRKIAIDRDTNVSELPGEAGKGPLLYS